MNETIHFWVDIVAFRVLLVFGAIIVIGIIRLKLMIAEEEHDKARAVERERIRGKAKLRPASEQSQLYNESFNKAYKTTPAFQNSGRRGDE